MSAAVCGVAKGLRVGIVGGSIAGCAMATELARIGCEVTVLERSGEELKDRGAGIGVPPSIFEMLVARDLIDADIPGFRIESVQRLCRTPEQAQYGYLAWSQPGDTIALNLGNLYRNLRHRVPDGAYRTRHQVAAIRQPDDDTAVAELADGYRSLGRQTLFPAPGVEYAGYVLWRGMLPGRKLLDTKPLEGVIVTPGYAG